MAAMAALVERSRATVVLVELAVLVATVLTAVLVPMAPTGPAQEPLAVPVGMVAAALTAVRAASGA